MSITWVGGGLDSMANICEPMINLVKPKWLKMLISHNQNGNMAGCLCPYWRHTDDTPSGKSRSLTCPVNEREHGKPVSLPGNRQVNRKEHLQGCGQKKSEKANASL